MFPEHPGYRNSGRLTWIVAGTSAGFAGTCWCGVCLATDPSDYQLRCWFHLGFYAYSALALLFFILAALRFACDRLADNENWFQVRAPFIWLPGTLITAIGIVWGLQSADLTLMMLGVAVMFTPTFIQWYKGPNDNPSPSRLLQFTGTAATLVAIVIFNVSRGFTHSELRWSGQNSTTWQYATLAMVALTVLALAAGWSQWVKANKGRSDR